MTCNVNTLLGQSSQLQGLSPFQLLVVQVQLLCNLTEGMELANCQVATLQANARRWCCVQPGQHPIIQAQLLCELSEGASGSCDVQELLRQGACFNCLDIGQLMAIKLTLLCTLIGGGGGCGTQVSTVTAEQTSSSNILVEWAPTNQNINLTIEFQQDGGSWETVLGSPFPDSSGSINFGVVGGEGSTFKFRIRRTGTATSCAVESNEVEFLAFGAFPNDSFESYDPDADLEGLNGGEHGNPPLILWESPYSVLPYGTTGEVTSPDGIPNLEQWISADTITGVDPLEALDTWEDQSGNNRDFTAAGAQRPTYETNVQNGLPGVNFPFVAGVGMTGPFSIAAGDFTILIVYKSTATNTGGRRLVQGANNWLMGPYSDIPRIFNNGFLQALYPTLDALCLVVRQTGTTLFDGYLNSIWFGRNTAGLLYPGLVHLGATGGFNEPAACYLFEMAVYSRALTEGEIFGVTWPLMLKWGLDDDIPPNLIP